MYVHTTPKSVQEPLEAARFIFLYIFVFFLCVYICMYTHTSEESSGAVGSRQVLTLLALLVQKYLLYWY
jgi:hypothetical protein